MIENSLSNYISHLQLFAFFAGYPLIYTLVNFLVADRHEKKSFLHKEWAALLPFAYALVGTLFLGLLLKNIFPDFSLKNIAGQFNFPYLEAWGIMAMFFWIPALRKKAVFCLLHSLPFFILLVKDFFMQTNFQPGRFVIENDMKMYSISFLLNMAALVFVFVVVYCLRYFRRSATAN